MHPTRIVKATDVLPYLTRFTRKRQEHFIVLTLDAAHWVLRVRTITIGIANRTIVHPREVFFPAIKDNAVAVIIAHNHPSGSLEPSDEDDTITDRLRRAGELMGIPVLDHLIISRAGYLSYGESGRLQ